jgi:hypothetical protein
MLHFLADWVLQGPGMGRKKSESYKVLLLHIAIIWATLAIGMLTHLSLWDSILLSFLNAVTHLIIDGCIWRLYRVVVWARNYKTCKVKLANDYKYWLDPVFGWFLGFDQLLHFMVLYWLYSGML